MNGPDDLPDDDDDYRGMCCPDCEGTGFADPSETFHGDCQTCGGAGEVDW